MPPSLDFTPLPSIEENGVSLHSDERLTEDAIRSLPDDTHDTAIMNAERELQVIENAMLHSLPNIHGPNATICRQLRRHITDMRDTERVNSWETRYTTFLVELNNALDARIASLMVSKRTVEQRKALLQHLVDLFECYLSLT